MSRGKPKILNSETLLNEFVHVHKDTLCFDNEKPYPYFVLETIAESTMILATTESGDFLVVEEYRHPVNAFVLSAPGGYLEKGENPIAAAKRELLEETGYTGDHFEIGGKTHPLPGIYNHTTTFVFAKGAQKKQAPKFDRSESITTLLLSPSDLKKKIQTSAHVDGILCTALFLYELSHGAL